MFFNVSVFKYLYLITACATLIGCNKQPLETETLGDNADKPATIVSDSVYATRVNKVPEQIFYGRVQGYTSYDLALFVDGRIDHVVVREGQLVNKGDVLATLYSPTLSQRVAARDSDYQSAKAVLLQAEAQKKRSTELVRKKLQSDAMLEDAIRALQVAKQQVNNTLAQLNEAQNQQQETQLVARHSGVIAKLYLRGGDYVNSGSNILRFESTERQKVTFSVPERIAIKLESQQQVTITLPNINATFDGHISERSLPSIGELALFDITVSIPDSTPNNVGLTAQLHLPITNQTLYKVVPSALRYDALDQAYLLTADGTTQYPVSVVAIEENGLLVTSTSSLDQPLSLVSETNSQLNLAQLVKR
ncbi:efflux RND transporter periplasmic adaptor subunit [Pseudoalteromonas sp. MMG013]|uniref:efflux RND transporter periplasmic adaptor subunit n=1 Tax=Pseudoalteromonas sp. MMG013 TaxID=2822687 RepID=UPI001B386D57|nr:efflux RND transporter periplasmic adaptor subunit [Pseudoalteromonas sp. MMG013]MBQ4863638.1 efflux RND transporter periplasmic adaptor subunit [Pseudoalteromonas sp. MMG013]